MSNLKAVDVTFCNIINLKNYVLTAYPLYLILGVPLKTISGIMYTPKPATEDLCFLFDIQELKLFLLAFADLLIHVYCLPDNFMIVFHHVLCHFLSYKEWNSTKGEETIKNLKYSDVNKICKSTCSKYAIEGSLFNFTDTLLRHKINLCMMYLIKKTIV